MYKIILYSGGVYRFDELVEFVEDSGGIILKKDEFHISRGAYFISQEVHVIIVLAEESIEDLKTVAKDLKGQIEILDVEYKYRVAIISFIPVYNLLSRIGWADLDTLSEKLECPCFDGICREFKDESCFLQMEKTLDDMCRMEIAEYRELSGIKEYHLK